ncbi:hypothetical protein ACS5PN_09470 [Roseateles sp. NT4]|uniref:hypothetical protein n=1 Tax=Roseateles sp. NT4 TaxID=3453715 RepID=UPI003EEE51AA
MKRLSIALAAFLLHASAHCVPICAAQFTEFLGRFERAEIDQAKHTKFPLLYSYPDHDDPNLKQKTLRLDRPSAEKYESFPSPGKQASLRLERTIANVGTGRCAVKFQVPDSDVYAMTFTFARWGRSWRLVAVEDFSL